MKEDISKQPKGSDLIQKYINALTTLITTERAKIAAEQTENRFLGQMESLGARNGVYLTPDEIPAEQGEHLLKESFNAHLTKVQSEQIISKSESEVARLQEQARKEYIDKRVTIEVLENGSKPLDAVYLDKRSGQYRISEYTAKKFKGTIQDISFENNLLVIKPSLAARTLTPNRVFIQVYVLDLETMTPNVAVDV